MQNTELDAETFKLLDILILPYWFNLMNWNHGDKLT